MEHVLVVVVCDTLAVKPSAVTAMVGPTTPLVVQNATAPAGVGLTQLVLALYLTESAKYASSAVIRLRRSDFIEARYAFSFVFANFGIAMAARMPIIDRKSTRLNSSNTVISYSVFCLKKSATNVTDGFRAIWKHGSCPPPEGDCNSTWQCQLRDEVMCDRRFKTRRMSRNLRLVRQMRRSLTCSRCLRYGGSPKKERRGSLPPALPP